MLIRFSAPLFADPAYVGWTVHGPDKMALTKTISVSPPSGFIGRSKGDTIQADDGPYGTVSCYFA
jgi:hypothetical protein